MNIAIFSKYFHPNIKGGGEISTLLIAKELVKKGHNIYIITLGYLANQIKKKKKKKKKRSIKVIRYSLPKIKLPSGNILLNNELLNLRVFFRCFKTIKALNIDIIHISSPNMIISGFLIAKLLQKPLILTVNSPVVVCYNGLGMTNEGNICNVCTPKLTFRCIKVKGRGKIYCFSELIYALLSLKLRIWTAQRTDGIITQSRKIKKMLLKNKFDSSRVHVLYGPIDLKLFDKTEKIQGKSLIKKVVYAGRLHKCKGLEYLIIAISEVVKRVPNTRFFIIGKGEDQYKLKNLIEQLKVEYFVELIDWMPYETIIEFFRNSDVIVLPSIYPEPFGRTIAEGMSVGKPVVVTNVCGVAELIENGENGFIIPPKDPKAIASVLIKILTNTELSETIGNNAQKTVGKLASLDVVVENLEEIHRTIKIKA